MASVLWMGYKSPEIVSTIYVYLGHVHLVITNWEKRFFTDPLTICILERKINEIILRNWILIIKVSEKLENHLLLSNEKNSVNL